LLYIPTNNPIKNTMPQRQGLTLIELVIVLIILVAISSIIVPRFAGLRDTANDTTTRASLVAIRDAMIIYFEDTKSIPLPGPTGTPDTVATDNQRFHVRWLFDNPVTGEAVADFDTDFRRGWNGPYLVSHTGTYKIDPGNNLTADYGSHGDKCVRDSYTGSPIVVQWANAPSRPCDLRVVSAGPNGIIDIQPDVSTELLTEDDIGDDKYVAFQVR
jgi:prepilin-type N-terminal cleavage/methylation domain-containing protein